jgi:hypothetical protein
MRVVLNSSSSMRRRTKQRPTHRVPFCTWWRVPRKRRNLYAGARVPASGRLATASARTSPQRFFERFVARRRPCVFRETLEEISGLAETLWASQVARDLEVQVEVRDGPRDAFGRGRKVSTTFGALLDGGSSNLYLTTQEVPDGQLLAAPLTAIADQLPLRPPLLGNLVPQTINLWLGRSSTPASSGLHHDFHDNLCVKAPAGRAAKGALGAIDGLSLCLSFSLSLSLMTSDGL